MASPILIIFEFIIKLVNVMAIAIKSIPTLQNEAAENFVRKAEASVKKRGTVNFSLQVRSANTILAKAQLK